MKKQFIALVLFTMFASNIQAQQDPHYTQYMYNMNVVNPAYAGSKESISGALLYRQQWAGLEGAPKTATFSIHSPVGKNVGLGLSAISDKIGPVEENNIYGDFLLNFSDFQLQPPKKIGGMVIVDERIRISVSLETH